MYVIHVRYFPKLGERLRQEAKEYIQYGPITNGCGTTLFEDKLAIERRKRRSGRISRLTNFSFFVLFTRLFVFTFIELFP